MLLNLIKGAV